MTRYRKVDVVDRAIEVLEERGIEELSMRNLAADLGVRPSALYHHVANKQALLAEVVDRILEQGRRATELVTWEAELRLIGTEVRDAMLAHRDGALLIAGVHAAGGVLEPERRMYDALDRAGAEPALARVGARTLLHFVFGHAIDAQSASGTVGGDRDAFATGIGLILDGLAVAIGRPRLAEPNVP